MDPFDGDKRENNPKKTQASLPLPLLVGYAQWFCYLRWAVIAILTMFGFLRYFPVVFQYFGFYPFTSWAVITAGILVIANIGFLKHIAVIKKSGSYDTIMVNIWIQVVVDLIILTAVIHYSGSIETLMPFAYLFHIVLACIYFSGRQSFIVTTLVCIFYFMCLGAEKYGLIQQAGLFTDSALRSQYEQKPELAVYTVISSIGIWLIVWYLVSHLSKMVRERDYELAETNRRLELVQEEKTRHMLRTTHELKAPFAAIDANIQLLFKGHCGVLSDKALEVMERIFTRSRRLGNEIQEMLQLSNLETVDVTHLNREDVDLLEIFDWCKLQVKILSEKKGIMLEEDLQPVVVTSNKDQMKMLFGNLLTNAVTYSHQHGHVFIQCRNSLKEGPLVVIEDHGIGISEEKISKIFNEYYRTDEAVLHNKNSSGLGLAIVKHVAMTNHIHIRVESSPGKGTKFILRFPPEKHRYSSYLNIEKEEDNVLSLNN